MWRSVRFLAALVLLLVASTLALAQEAVVTRNVNLRRDPSTTQPPIRLLVPPDTVELLEPGKTNGYYHVRTKANEEGWVWTSNVRLLQGPMGPLAAAPPPAPTGYTFKGFILLAAKTNGGGSQTSYAVYTKN